MPRPASFLFAWDDNAPRPDPSMTRARAARLLRAWRANPRDSVRRIAPGSFRVIHHGANLSAVLIVTR